LGDLKTMPKFDLDIKSNEFPSIEPIEVQRDNTTNVTQGGKEIILDYELNTQNFSLND
jgi:hypothetical protein